MTESTQPQPELKPDITQVFTTYAMQAMIACGQMPNPMTEKTDVSLPLARYHIGMMEMLEAKTQGNLTDEERAQVEAILHQVRMLFVETTRQHNAPTETSSET